MLLTGRGGPLLGVREIWQGEVKTKVIVSLVPDIADILVVVDDTVLRAAGDGSWGRMIVRTP
jgi:hypothetical protein